MGRIRISWQKKRKSNARILLEIRRKKYRNKSMTRFEKIIADYQTMECYISHHLVENSKCHESDRETIKQIRAVLDEYSPNHGFL